MKAIKLASVFAVSAVAAAVSTATFAAEPVFSGKAGLEYSTTGKNNGDSKAWDSKGELNISVDTGVVRLFIDGDTAEGDLQLDEAVVTQGAVQFGDFDGSISDDGYLKATREIEGEYGDGSVTDIGVRYAVMPGLTVALEMSEGNDGVGFAAKYSQDLGVAAVTVSGGTYSGDWKSTTSSTTVTPTALNVAAKTTTTSTTVTTKTEVTNYAIGVSVPAGDMATVVASYAAGTKNETPKGGTKSETKYGSVVVGATLNVSDALTIGLQHSMNQEAATGADDSNTEIAAFYTAGDVTYYAASLTGDKSKEKTVIGAKASF